MKRLWFALFTLPVSVLLVIAAWLLLTTGGLNWVYLQLRDQPSFRLDIERLDGSFASSIRLSGLVFVSDSLSLELEQAELEFSLISLALGELEVQQLQLARGELELAAAEGDDPLQPGTLRIDMPLRRIAVERLHLSAIDIVYADTRRTLNQLETRFDIDSEQFNLTQLTLSTAELKLSAHGQAALLASVPFDVQAEWQVTSPALPTLSGSGRVHGDLERLRLEQILTAPTPLQLSAEVDSPLTELRWQARVQVRDFMSRQWRIQGPEFRFSSSFTAEGDMQSVNARGTLAGEHPASGPLRSEFNLGWGPAQRLEIHALKLQSAQSDSEATAQGWWRPASDGGELDVKLGWQALRWPLDAQQPVWSPSGTGHLRGRPGAYRFDIDSASPLAELPQARLRAQGQGNLDGLEFDLLQITSDKARIISTGRVDWEQHLSWRASSEASDIDPALLLPEWPGRLSLRAEHQGEFVDGALSVRAHIERAVGELRGYAVSLSGDAAWRDGVAYINDAVFHSADSRVQVSGTVNEQIDLNWRIDSPRLDELYPQLRGRIKASGRVSGSLDNPRVQASVKAGDLVYAEYSAQSLDAEITLALQNLAGVQGNLSATGVDFLGQHLTRLQLQGDSSQASLRAELANAKLDVAVAGRLQDGQWRGQLRRAGLSSDKLGRWTLEAASALRVDSDWQPVLDQACWRSDDSRLCARIQPVGLGLQTRLNLSGLALQRLQHWLPAGLVIDGTAAAEATLDYARQRVSGSGLLKLSPGRIAYPVEGEDTDSLQHEGGQLALVLDDDGVSATAQLALEENDRITARLQLPGATVLAFDASRQRLSGEIKASVERLTLLGELIPEVQRLTGRLNAEVRLSGVVKQPQIAGQLALTGGRLEVPRLGLTVSDISLQAHANDTDRIHYRLQGRSGDGRLEVSGYAQSDSEGRWSTRLNIDGKGVEVSHIPEAQILASPSVSVMVAPYRIDLDGRIEIPYAHIEPRDITSTARVSRDVVIVGEEQPREQPWQIHSRVQVVMGERVHFNGFGLEGRLYGQVLIEESPGLPTRASGEISIVEGRYRAYGQRLVIEQGSLLFTGGPVVSPGVDARAVRKVGAVTAGVRARGQIQQPVIELFSTPAMGQTEILSYLLLGRPIDKASESDGAMMAQAAIALGLTGGDRLARNLRDRFGLDEMRVESNDSGDQASLVIGRYLSPRLYVSYGIGLVEAFNTLVVRYDISDKWQLKAESGEAHGADLIYTIER